MVCDATKPGDNQNVTYKKDGNTLLGIGNY